ncbi:MAG: hypothetical protein AABY13_03790, partial [Nanoarchaeota archaeon]
PVPPREEPPQMVVSERAPAPERAPSPPPLQEQLMPTLASAKDVAATFERPVLTMTRPRAEEMPPALPVMQVPLKERPIARPPQPSRPIPRNHAVVPVRQAPRAPQQDATIPSVPDEQWVEVIQMWHEAAKQGRWDVALNVADVFGSLGPIPQDRVFEVSVIREQADLLHQAQELGSYPDVYMRRAALQRFYDRYNETVRDHPGATLLYQHLKSLYVSALLSVTKT